MVARRRRKVTEREDPRFDIWTAWRACPSFPGVEVSEHGDVRRWDGRHGRWVALQPHPRGHSRRGRRYQGMNVGQRQRYHHELVLDAWHGPRPEGMQARHLDGDPTNNAPTNLVWGTAKQNAADRVTQGTQAAGSRSRQAKLTEEMVRAARARIGAGARVSAIAAQLGVQTSTLWRACLPKDHPFATWKHVA